VRAVSVAELRIGESEFLGGGVQRTGKQHGSECAGYRGFKH
jgi:hypothetical protein